MIKMEMIFSIENRSWKSYIYQSLLYV
jgi:hypothetical protein